MLTLKPLAENDVNMASKHAKCRQNVTIDVLHPSCKTTFPSPVWVHGNYGRVCKKKFVSTGENRGKPFLAYQIRISEVFAWDRHSFLTQPKLHPFLEISTFKHIDVSFKSASFSLNCLETSERLKSSNQRISTQK